MGPAFFARALQTAGFVDVDVRAVPMIRDVNSVDDAVSAMEQNSTMLRELLGKVGQSQQPQLMAALRLRLSDFVQQPDGRCVIPGEALLGVASA